jgi:hypothetical protein
MTLKPVCSYSVLFFLDQTGFRVMPKNLTAERAQKNRAAEGEPSTLHGLQSNQ